MSTPRTIDGGTRPPLASEVDRWAPARWLGAGALAAWLLFAAPAAAQSDTTVRGAIDIRIRTRVDTVTLRRVDTVTVRLPAPPPSVRVDTVRIGMDTTAARWSCWQVYGSPSAGCMNYGQINAILPSIPLYRDLVLRRDSLPAGSPNPLPPTVYGPPPVVTPPVVTPPVVVLPGDVHTTQEAPTRIGVFRGAERIGQVAPSGNIAVTPWTHWLAWRSTGPGTICMNDVDYPTEAAALAGVTAPYSGRDLCAPPANPPELPRATVDTTMPATPLPAKP